MTMDRMNPERLSDAERAALIATFVCQIRQWDESEKEYVLAEFLSTAWPSRLAQSQ